MGRKSFPSTRFSPINCSVGSLASGAGGRYHIGFDKTEQELPKILHSHCINAKNLLATLSSVKPEVASSSLVGPAPLEIPFPVVETGFSDKGSIGLFGLNVPTVRREGREFKSEPVPTAASGSVPLLLKSLFPSWKRGFCIYLNWSGESCSDAARGFGMWKRSRPKTRGKSAV